MGQFNRQGISDSIHVKSRTSGTHTVHIQSALAVLKRFSIFHFIFSFSVPIRCL